MRKCFAVFALFMMSSVLVVAAAEHPFGLNRNHPYGILTTDYVTPHIPWANPYRGGRAKVLVLAPYWSQRETVELAERLSIDFTAWMPTAFTAITASMGDPAFSFFQPPPELVHRLLKEYVRKDYDVIIVGKLEWSIIPAKQRFEILKKVAEGTGFIYVNPPEGDKELELVFKGEPAPEGRNFITANLPLSSLPRFEGKDLGKLVRTSMFGKGRVVVLDYQEPAPGGKAWESSAWPCLTPLWDMSDSKEEGFIPLSKLPEMEFVPYEYYQALVARAVIWAGKKEPKVRIKDVSLDETISWPASKHEALITIEKVPSGSIARAVVRDRHTYGKTFALGEKKAAQRTVFWLPDLPAGEYFLDVWVLDRDGKKIFTWASRHFEVKADFTFGEITLKGKMHNPGEPIEGQVLLPRLLETKEKVNISLWDNFDREIASKDVKPAGMLVAFRFDPFEVLTILHRIEVRLLRDGKEVTMSKLDFPIRARLRWDDFNTVIWSSGMNNFLTHLMLRKLAKYDEADSIDIGWRGATDARNIAAANLSHTPYTARYGVFGSSKDNIVKATKGSAYGCMSNPITFEALDEWGDRQSQIYGPYGPFVWTHGDETNYGFHAPDICWSETCLKAFRDYLKEVYSSIDELNKEWKTNYKSFDEAMPLTFKEAKKTGVYARWVTHRLSSDRVFARFYRRSGQALAKNDPGGRGAGFDGGVGLTRPNSGADWWVLSKNLDLLHAYCGDAQQMEVFRSFARPEQVRGMWYGTYGLTWTIGPNTVPFCHFFPWYSLFHGLNSTWFWTMGNPGPLSGYAPDMTSLPFFKARTEALKQIKSGIGKLLLHSARQNDGIAIHFSEASRIAASFYAAKEGDWSKDYAEALVNFNKALEDCGLQYEYLSYEEVANGELVKQKFRVFIMPHSRAVSQKEAEEILEFARRGGVVIADIIPGILNEKGTPQEKSLLADLFPADKKGTVTSFGKGEAILVGKDFLAGYGKAHMNRFGWRKLEGRWKLLGDLLKEEADIEPKVRIEALGTGEIPPTEVTRFKCGENEFVSLLREYFLYDNNPYKVRITFPYRSHLYDVMEGKYLGFTKSITTEISYKAKLYCLARYKVDGVELRLPETASAGSTTKVQIAVKAAGGAQPSRHSFRLEVVAPKGGNLSYYARNIIAEKGQAEAEIPWALNEAPGVYVVTVRDVMSGARAEKTVTLK